jgi:two-component system sensor histidine kinase/response regulator
MSLTDNNARVMLVDDNEKNIVVLQSFLNRAGISSFSVTSGQEAIRLARELHPELILLDIMMPETDGYTVCETLKNDPQTRDISIIFISALNSKEDIIHGFELGGIDYITKPFNKEEVLARVKTHLTLKSQQKQLEQANTLLREALATKDRLFSIISHDLMGPIVNISNVMKLLIDSELPRPEQLEFLNGALSSNASTLELLKNLLSWAKSQRNEIRFNPHNIDVSIIINDNIKLMQGIMSEKKIYTANRIRQTLMCFADENMLTLVFRNLLSNAIKYSHPQSTIEIYHQEEDDWMTFCVRDNGVGIAPDNIRLILDAGEHFTTPGTAYEKGHGLGLTLCKEFVEMHGGKLIIESEPENGSLICFSIPKHLTDFKH